MQQEELQRIGRDLVLYFVSAMKIIQTHGADNEAARSLLDRFALAIDQQIVQAGSVQLDCVDGMILLNGTRLRPPSTQLAQFTTLAQELAMRGIGGVAFQKKIDAGALRAFFSLFVHRTDTVEQATAVRDAIFRYAPPGIVPLELRTMTTTDPRNVVRASTMAFALRAYGSAMLAFHEFVAAIRAGRNPWLNRLNVVRVVQELIDAAFSRADLLLFAIQLEKARGPRAGFAFVDVHAANTCAYAVLLGRLLELERTMLLDLGTSALLADVSSALVVDENAGALTPEQKYELEKQMTRAVKLMLGEGQGTDDAVLTRAIVAYERQRPVVAPGAEQRPLHMYSRIVAVAGAYDAMSSDRPWRPAMSMSEALATMTQEAGTKFDPLVVAALNAMLTTYFSREHAAGTQ